jgi:5-formyltetrahydrofolate cyclo-ligase
MEKSIQEKLSVLVAGSDVCVLYQPVRSEVDPKSLPFELPSKQVAVPVGPSTDPQVFGREISEKFGDMRGVILVPGRMFDKFGGRRGKGYGWYDRFLSAIPARWVRIGVCSRSEFSSAKLVLQEWDEVMDWVVVSDNGTFIFYEAHSPSSPSRLGK